MALAPKEGRIDQRAAVLVLDIPWTAETTELENIICAASGGRIDGGGVEDDHVRALHNKSKVARYTLNSRKAKDRLVAKAKKGHVMVSGKILTVEHDLEASRARDEDDWTRGTIFMLADSITPLSLTGRHQAVPAKEIDRTGLARLEVDTQRERIVWGYPDSNPDSGLCHLFVLPFTSITKIDFWQGGFEKDVPLGDAFMGVRVYRLPETLVFPIADHFSKSDLDSPYSTDAEKLYFLNENKDELANKIRKDFSTGQENSMTSPQSVFFNSFETSPLQTCDYLVFRMRDKLSQLQTSPLLSVLAKYKMISSRAGRDSLHNARAMWHKPFPTWDIECHAQLPYRIRGAISSLLSFGVISAVGYGHILMPLILETLVSSSEDIVILILKNMLHRNAAPYLELSSKGMKIFDADLETEFREKKKKLISGKRNDPPRNQIKLRSQVEIYVDQESDQEFYMVSELFVTPSKIYCTGPFPRQSNRLLRKYHDDARRGAFTLVHFVAERLRPEFITDTDPVELPLEHIQVALQDGITYYAEHFEFVLSASRRAGTPCCWFINTTISSVGGAQIREWLGGFKYFKSPTRCMRTFGLAVEPIQGRSWVLTDDEWIAALDEREKMADHHGLISYQFAKEVTQALNLRPAPSCFEVLFRGEKRLLITYDLPENIKIVFPTQSLSPSTEMTSVLNICNVGSYKPGSLTRNQILLLAERGVPNSVFSTLFERQVGRILSMTTNKQKALDLMLSESLDISLEIQRTIANLLDGDVVPFNDGFLREVLQAIQNYMVLHIRKSGKILVPKSGKFYYALDPTKTLRPGEASLTVKRPDPDGSGSWERTEISGKIISIHESAFSQHDIHVYQAVSPPAALELLDNVFIYCPTDEMSKSQAPSHYFEREWDVEETNVFWDEDLLPMNRLLPTSQTIWNREDQSEIAVDLKDVQSLFLSSVNSVRPEVASNNFLVWAEKRDSSTVFCSRLGLAAKYASVINLSGKATEFPRDLVSRTLPDFLEHEEKTSYTSSSIIGQLHTSVISLTSTIGRESGAATSLTNLTRIGHEAYLENADELCKVYTSEIQSLLYEFACSESELFAEVPLSICLLDVDHNVRQRLKISLGILRGRYKSLFYDDPDMKNLSRRLQKASAWYIVSQKKSRSSSFSWTVPVALRELYTVSQVESGSKRRRIH